MHSGKLKRLKGIVELKAFSWCFLKAIKTKTTDDGNILETEVNTMSYLDLKDAANYSSNAFREGDDRRAWDSGNLTKEDGIFYDKLFSQAMDARVGTIETD